MDHSEKIKLFRYAAVQLIEKQYKLFKQAEVAHNYGRMAEVESFTDGLEQMLLMFDQMFDPLAEKKGD